MKKQLLKPLKSRRRFLLFFAVMMALVPQMVWAQDYNYSVEFTGMETSTSVNSRGQLTGGNTESDTWTLSPTSSINSNGVPSYSNNTFSFTLDAGKSVTFTSRNTYTKVLSKWIVTTASAQSISGLSITAQKVNAEGGATELGEVAYSFQASGYVLTPANAISLERDQLQLTFTASSAANVNVTLTNFYMQLGELVDYGITVAGVEVTSVNAADVLGDGKVSYNDDMKTLTLNGATMNGNIVRTNSDDLNVNLIGENTLTITNQNDYVFAGSGKLMISSDEATFGSLKTIHRCSKDSICSGWDSYPSFTLPVNDGTASRYDCLVENYSYLDYMVIQENTKYALWIGGQQFCKAMLEPDSGIKFVPATSTLEYGYYGQYNFTSSLPSLTISVSGETQMGSVTFSPTDQQPAGTLTIAKNAESEADINSLTLSNDDGVITGFSEVTIENPMYVVTPATAPETWDETISNAVIADGQPYELKVAGVTVTSKNAANILSDDETNNGKVSYNATTNTLTLNNANIDLTSSNDPVEVPGIDCLGTSTLTISLIGDNTIRTGAGCEAIRYNGQNIPGPSLAFEKGNTLPCSLQLESEGQSVISTGFNQIDGVNNINSSTGNALMLISDEAVMYEYQYQGLYTGVANITPVSSALITSGYGISVGSVIVHSGNASDITGDYISGNGTVSFNAETNTLTLTGDVIIGDGGIAWGIDDDLTIRFSGTENRISTLTTSAVYCTGDITGKKLYLVEGSSEDDCELWIQTSESISIIGNGFTKTYQEDSRLVDYNMTVENAETGNLHALCSTTTFSAPVIYLDSEANTPQAVISMSYTPGGSSEFEYNDMTLYYSTDGETYNTYTQPVTMSAESPMVYGYAKVRNTVQSAISRGKYVCLLNAPETLILGKDSTVTFTEIGNGDGWTYQAESVLYESDHEDVATFENGTVTAVGVGTATLSVNLQEALDIEEGTTDYAYPLIDSEGVLSFTVKVLPPKPEFSLEEGTYNGSQTIAITSNYVTENPQTSSIKYYLGTDSSVNPLTYSEVLTVSENTTLNAWVEAHDAEGNPFVSDTIRATYVIRQSPNLRYVNPKVEVAEEEVETATATYGQGFTSPEGVQPELKNNNEVAVSYSSSNESVATIDEDGTVSLVGVGTTVIMALSEEDDVWQADSAKYTLTVSARSLNDAIVTITDDAQTYTYTGSAIKPNIKVSISEQSGETAVYVDLVKDTDYTVAYTDSINAGEGLITVTGKGNYTGTLTATYTITKATLSDFSVSLEGWAFGSEPKTPEVSGNLGKGTVTYQYKVKDADDATYSETVPSAVGDYTVKASVAETTNYNAASATADFSIVNRTLTEGVDVTFASGQTWATYYTTTEDLTLPDGIVAYVVTEVGEKSVAVQAISNVPKNVPVLLEKTSESVQTSDNVDVNQLVGASEAKAVSSITGGTVYVLYNNEFVKTTSGTIPAHRCYLVVHATAQQTAPAPRLAIGDGGDATGIFGIAMNDGEGEGWYDLNGRKQQGKPSKKGVYIQNGKKIFVINK